jgi:acyl carrier protein
MRPQTAAAWVVAVRELLAAVLERPPGALAALPDETPLFGETLNLDSFTGMALLTAIQARYHIDVAADDLGLDSLETIGTLAAYLAAQP